MSYPLGWSTRLTAEPVTMAGSSLLAVLAMAELTPALDTVLELLRSPLGAVLFVPLYALWVTLLLPGVWASMLAGVLYGTWGGSALVFVGACLGAVATFLLGRHWLRDWARRRLEQLPKLGGGAGREQGGFEVGVADAPLTRFPLLAAQPGLRPQ